MPFDTNGTFNRVIPGGWQGDRDAGTKITAVRHDDEDDGFATGLSECITRTGKTTVLANIPFNGKKITGLGEPDDPGDAATKNYVDTIKTFNTGLSIDGAGPVNGFLNFTSLTGVNGIGFWNVDMSWIGRPLVTNQSNQRVALNNAKDGTGNDVFALYEDGSVNSNGVFMSNLAVEGANYRTPVVGFGTYIKLIAGATASALSAMANDIATTTAFQITTLREFFKVFNSGGSPFLDLNKSASGKVSALRGTMAGKPRWLMYLGNATPETATERIGSDLAMYSYTNDGVTAYQELIVNRATHKWTFTGEVSAGLVTSAQNFDSVSTVCILSATSGGSIRLRPDGPTVTTSSTMFDTNGSILIAEGAAAPGGGIYGGLGYRGKAGQSGAYAATWNNMYWDGTFMRVYVGTTNLGNIAWQCDHRIKKDVVDLTSTWEKVKALRPVSFRQRQFGIFEENDTVRWGFIAHELQQNLLPSAALGEKDDDDVVQSPDPMALIAGLTRALQEAMQRIEALEGLPAS